MPLLFRLRILALCLDFLLITTAFCLAYFTKVGFIFSTDLPFPVFFGVSLISAAFWIISLMVFRGYNPFIRFNTAIHIFKVLIAGLTSTALFGLVFYFTQKSLFSRLLMIYMFSFGSIATLANHFLIEFYQKKLTLAEKGITRLLLIGSNRGVKRFIKKLLNTSSPFVPVAILDGYGSNFKEIHGIPILGKLNILEKVVDEYQIDAIVQGDNIEQIVNIVHFAQQNNLRFYLLPYVLGVFQDKLSITHLEQALITLDDSRNKSWWSKLLY